jgi:hypothetical protein
MRHPPTRATRLLLQLGPQDEAFIGDRIEEYRAGRSRAWYWRQVLSAVLLSTVRHVGAHRGRTVAAVATGWSSGARRSSLCEIKWLA